MESRSKTAVILGRSVGPGGRYRIAIGVRKRNGGKGWVGHLTLGPSKRGKDKRLAALGDLEDRAAGGSPNIRDLPRASKPANDGGRRPHNGRPKLATWFPFGSKPDETGAHRSARLAYVHSPPS